VIDKTSANMSTSEAANGSSPPPALGNFARAPAGVVGGPAVPPTIPLSVEEYQRLRALEGQLEEVRKVQHATLEAKEADRLRALAEKGQIEEALEQQRKAWEQKHGEAVSRYSQLEQQVHAERRNMAIAEAFQGRMFVGETSEQRAGTAAMVRRLLQEEFEAGRDASGAVVVREKVTGRPATEVLRERLDSPSFAIFFAPTARGGSGSDGSRPPANLQSATPGSLDSIVSEWRNRQSQYQSFGLHPRT
jgi:hypothetical protein